MRAKQTDDVRAVHFGLEKMATSMLFSARACLALLFFYDFFPFICRKIRFALFEKIIHWFKCVVCYFFFLCFSLSFVCSNSRRAKWFKLV